MKDQNLAKRLVEPDFTGKKRAEPRARHLSKYFIWRSGQLVATFDASGLSRYPPLLTLSAE